MNSVRKTALATFFAGFLPALLLASAELLAVDAVTFSRVKDTSPAGLVHFAENGPALAALKRMAPEAASERGPAATRAAVPPSASSPSVLRARGSGRQELDQALRQLLQGMAVLDGELSRRGASEGVVRVQPGDTLDEIIFRTLGDLSVRHEVVRSAFLKANPRAFRRSNPNYLLAGVELRIPTADDFRAVVFDDPEVGKVPDRRRMIRYP